MRPPGLNRYMTNSIIFDFMPSFLHKGRAHDARVAAVAPMDCLIRCKYGGLWSDELHRALIGIIVFVSALAGQPKAGQGSGVKTKE